MKKLILTAICALLTFATAIGFTACNGEASSTAVNLVDVKAEEVGVRTDIDYYVIAEPAATVKVNALEGLEFSGNLQELYADGNGYPQAVVVAKNEVVSYVAQTLSVKLKNGAEWLIDDATAPESIVSAVSSHLSNDLAPTFNAKNLNKEVIKNCSVKFTDAWNCKQAVKDIIEKFNACGETNFSTPDDNFFLEEGDYGTAEYDGKITVYAPDGAPALGLAKLMATNELINCKEVEYNVVKADTIQAFVTGNAPKADVCVLPVNLAVKLLGSGEKYKMLGTLTNGNLFIVSNGKEKITKNNLSSLRGKTVGVVNLAQVPGLTFKTILKDNGIEYGQLI
ncbi:MAG: hypothetical protein HDQ88_09915 [Clostridia bacterium]|nr:hypothetical protein [Clostridia bacterium]